MLFKKSCRSDLCVLFVLQYFISHIRFRYVCFICVTEFYKTHSCQICEEVLLVLELYKEHFCIINFLFYSSISFYVNPVQNFVTKY